MRLTMCTSDGKAYWSDTKGGGWRPSSIHSSEIAALEKLAAYEDAEEQGLLVWLPCKVGDTVYVEWSGGQEYSKSVVEKISIGTDGKVQFLIPAYLHSHSASWYQISDFGKTVFLSREAAEAALKGGIEDV